MKNGYTQKLPIQVPYVEYHKEAYSKNSIDEIISTWKEEWYIHHDNVISHFKYRPADLLIFDIENDPFTKIADFFRPCGFVFEINQLPHSNKTQDCA